MFTGIVERMGTLAELKPMAGGYRLRVETAMAGELRPETAWPWPASA